MANLLGSHNTTVTMVTRTAPPLATPDKKNEGVAEDKMGVAEDSVEAEWEALKLHLSRDELTAGTELESLIIRDLTIRHQTSIAAGAVHTQ